MRTAARFGLRRYGSLARSTESLREEEEAFKRLERARIPCRSLWSDDRVYALEQISRMVARSRRYCQDEGREDDAEFYTGLRCQVTWVPLIRIDR